jgi:pimeloyl-ACP methyl ester carboxylesterase
MITILIVHPGMDDGMSWHKVASRLRDRFRVVTPVRRRYNTDLPARPMCSIADEAADIVALARSFGVPVVVVGHSSGAVVALEALVAAPDAFSGAILYEPPIVIGPPLGGEATVRAQRAISQGKVAKAIRIFLRDIVRIPSPIAVVAGAFIALNPRMRALAPRQIDDATAIDDLGNRLTAYHEIKVRTVLLGGDRSPAHLGARLDALADVLPNAQRVVMHRQGHGANVRSPGAVADLIADFAASSPEHTD